MWIIPNNHPLYSVFAQDMVEQKEDLNELSEELTHSFMSRSKITRLKTWLTRWRKDTSIQHLFGRTLKPCHATRFEIALISLLEATPASPLVSQGKASGQLTLDISGPTSPRLYATSLHGWSSLKMSKDTSIEDLEKSLKIWEASVIKRRGEYSVRKKLAPLTGGNGFSSWPTPNARDYKGCYKTLERQDGKKRGDLLPDAANIEDQMNFRQLNPAWVEHLMGLPRGWTQLSGPRDEDKNNSNGKAHEPYKKEILNSETE